MTCRTTAAADAFTRRFGHAPDGIWAAPGRVNLIGEHTDYNLGFALPLAIDRSTLAAVSLRNDSTVRATALDTAYDDVTLAAADISPGAVTGWAAYPLGVVWAFAQRGVEIPGLELQLGSDVPIGAGLSSSAALECSVAVALNDLLGAGFEPPELVQICRQAENEMAGAPTGILDQTASLLGRGDHALLLDCRSLATQPVPLPLREAGLQLLVVDTKVSHSHASGGYSARRADCARAVEALGVDSLRDVEEGMLPEARGRLDQTTFRRVRHVVTENQRVLETAHLLTSKGQASGPAAIGDLLTASHVSLRDDYEVSCAELDLAVDTALQHGALGARMTGGGFGGSAIALVPEEAAEKVGAAVVNSFRMAGLKQPDVFPVAPADGARRVA
ncbi:galactokinase [Arthrobacter crystallopoietes]|uniref:Galactokinase n=1 Tax=Crystallibacter crystallopoietes TaxID=37928 RepID=A0A1H1A1K6_9MICC|nr:galactokinase [Arthrobacter crystallopoietes]AUI51720.1 galactokinase [Arthrobacter crystallopoietes]SDQ33548.1 galactokinase [Arthrobacter crystallopoietes]